MLLSSFLLILCINKTFLALIVGSGGDVKDSVPFEVFHKRQDLLLPDSQPIA